MPFDDNESDIIPTPIRKIGVKKENATTSNVNDANNIKANFENKADAQFSKIEEYKQQIWDLSIKYKSFIDNKILPVNRGPISNNLEKEVLDKLVQLSTEMNEDELLEQGMGSTALCMLLMKCMLMQRDAINILSCKVDQFEKKLIIPSA
jgi:hypothetical protein